MAEMELRDFETLLHLSVAFNFFYSAFNDFSDNITMFFSGPLLNIPKKALTVISGDVEEIKSLTLKGKFYEHQLCKELDDNFIELSNEVNNFANSEGDDLEYGKKFKSAYLLIGFYSLFLIILCGFHAYYSGEKLYHSLCIVNWILAILLTYVSISSVYKLLPRITAGLVLIIFFVLLITFAILYNNMIYTKLYDVIPNNNYTIYFSIILVLAPFFLHFLRVVIEIIMIINKVSNLKLRFSDLLAKIKGKAIKLDEAQKLMDEYN